MCSATFRNGTIDNKNLLESVSRHHRSRGLFSISGFATAQTACDGCLYLRICGILSNSITHKTRKKYLHIVVTVSVCVLVVENRWDYYTAHSLLVWWCLCIVGTVTLLYVCTYRSGWTHTAHREWLNLVTPVTAS